MEVMGPCVLDAEGQLAQGVAAQEGPGIALRYEADVLIAQSVGGAPLHLNAVQITGPVVLQPGDELRHGALRASLLRETRIDRRRARPEALLEPWLEAAVARAAVFGTSVTLELGAGMLPQERPGEASFPLAAQRWLRVREGSVDEAAVCFPRDGTNASALLAQVLGARDAEAAPLALEPTTLRLSQMLEELAVVDGPLLVEGEPGVGRAFRAAHWLRRRGYARVVRLSGMEPSTVTAIAHAGVEVGLLVEDVERLDPDAQRVLAQREGSWAATSSPAAALEPVLAERFARTRLHVPPLRDRSQELSAMLDAELLRLRESLGRPSLQLDRAARELVLTDAWLDNLDGLRACLSRAAYVSRGEWIRVEDLPVRLRTAVVSLGLDEAREAAERAILLHALQQARWNVAETARRLGMPRRTLVHRMKVVGLKRPARSERPAS